MSKICKKCKEEFSNRLVIDEKVYNLQNRKYCLNCSPFKQHNTKVLEGKPKKQRFCKSCNKEIVRKNEKGTKCWHCVTNASRQKKIEKIQYLVGDSCWCCGYNRCWQALDLHHVDSKNKKFNITKRELQYAWHKIEAELRKCILVCCRCHREIHAGIIPDKLIQEKWRKLWSEVETKESEKI